MSDFKPTLAIDLDGVLAQYSGWQGEDHIGLPYPTAFTMVRRFIDNGLKVAILTTRGRSSAGRKVVYDWLAKHGMQENYLKQIDITGTKIPALLYIDDRAWRFNGRWPEPEEVFNFKPWYYKDGMKEDQHSIAVWTLENFPIKENHERMAALMKEVIELAWAEGMTAGEIADLCGASLAHVSKQKDRGVLSEEVGDVQICLYAFAESEGIDTQMETERKMRRNRLLSFEDAQKKRIIRSELFYK